MKLPSLCKISELAEALEIPIHRLRRVLSTLAEQYPEILIPPKSNGSYALVDLTALKKVAPTILTHVQLSSTEFRHLNERVTQLEKVIND